MSQQFNNYSGALHKPLSSTGQSFEDLSGSLIYPGPSTLGQQNYQPIWPGNIGWQNHGHNNNQATSYQTSTKEPSNHYRNHQSKDAPLERKTNYYEIGNSLANLGDSESVQGPQPGENAGTHTTRDNSQFRLPDHVKQSALNTPSAENQRKSRGRDGVVNSPKPKQDAGALNDRAAELRARLLAKRGSTPVAPSNIVNKPAPQSNMVKNLNEISNLKNDQTVVSIKKIIDSQTAAPLDDKTSSNDTAQVSTRKNSINKSPKNISAPFLGTANASADIDRLLAEGKAAAAAVPTRVSKNTGDLGKNSVLDSSEGLKKPSSLDKNHSASKPEDHHTHLGKSASPSDTSELGEIRSDSGRVSGAFNAPPEPVETKAFKGSFRPQEQKLARQVHSDTDSAKQSASARDNDPEDGGLPNSEVPKLTNTKKTTSSDALPLQSHNQSKGLNLENSRDKPSQNPGAMETQKGQELDRRQDSQNKEKHETRRLSAHHPYGHRDRIEHRRDNDIRRLYVPRYDADENARAAAEYKKDLEARRQLEARAAVEKSDRPRDHNRRQVDIMRPKTPDQRISDKKYVINSSDRLERPIERNSEEKRVKKAFKESPDSAATENIADVRDWLDMTGYFDINYRNNALTRFRKIRLLDLQRAELEREAQLEIEKRAHFPRSQSSLLRESVEASSSTAVISPTDARSSILAMPPPPSSKHIIDDIGIKIKNSANRDGLSRETDWYVDKNAEPLRTTQTLKRTHLDDDPDYIQNQPVGKISRIESNGRMINKKPLESPTTIKGEHRYNENRATRSGVNQPNQLRARSRSPKSRSRSSSPSRGRALVYDQYIPRQRSRDTITRKAAYSPGRQSNSASIEKFNKADTRWCRHCEQSGHTTQNCFKLINRRETSTFDTLNNYPGTSPHIGSKRDIKKEGDQIADNLENNETSESRPFIGHYQQYQPPYYRGRSRGGKAGFASFSNRVGFKQHRLGEETQDRQDSGGSASLNLQAGGWSPHSRYFMIKSWNYENVEIAQRDCTWATQEKNLAVLKEAFNTCRNVILVFSVNNSRAFQGYARMTSLPGTAPTPSWAKDLIWEATPPFHIQWITIAETRFSRVGHLRNSLNEMQAVLVGRDGQEIEGECGRALCELIDEEGRSGNDGWGSKPERTTSTEA